MCRPSEGKLTVQEGEADGKAGRERQQEPEGRLGLKCGREIAQEPRGKQGLGGDNRNQDYGKPDGNATL